MSDTKITPDERALWASVATARINAVTPERQCEITAQERLVNALKALKHAEARVKSRNNHIHRLLGEALENERNLDGMKSRWQTAEAENERLTKERDWLANKLIDCPPEFTNCEVDCAECRKEAARWAVYDSEVKG